MQTMVEIPKTEEQIRSAWGMGSSKQESIIDQIRSEIADLEEGISSYHNDRPWVFKDEVLQIIDKYKAESEDENE